MPGCCPKFPPAQNFDSTRLRRKMEERKARKAERDKPKEK